MMKTVSRKKFTTLQKGAKLMEGAMVMTKFEETGWCRGIVLECERRRAGTWKIRVLYEDQDEKNHYFPNGRSVICHKDPEFSRFKLGESIMAQDSEGLWHLAEVLAIHCSKVCLSWDGWDSSYNEWFDGDLDTLASLEDYAKFVSNSSQNASMKKASSIKVHSSTSTNEKKPESCNFDPECWDRAKKSVKKYCKEAKFAISFIEAYENTWVVNKSQKRLKPMKELENAKERVTKCKRHLLHILRELRSTHLHGYEIQDNFFGPAASKYENIQCCICYSALPTETAGNDVIICDGTCKRAYHQNCLYPPVKQCDIPKGEEEWLCHLCSCERSCVESINRAFATNYSTADDLLNAKLFLAADMSLSDGSDTDDLGDLDDHKQSTSHLKTTVDAKTKVKYDLWWEKAVNGMNGSEDEEFCPDENDLSDDTLIEEMGDCQGQTKEESKNSKASCEVQRAVVDLVDAQRTGTGHRFTKSLKHGMQLSGGEQKFRRSTRRRKRTDEERDEVAKKKKRIAGTWKVTWHGQIRVRKTPRINGEILGCLSCGDCIEVTMRHGKWVQHKGGWSLSEDAGDILIQRVKSDEIQPVKNDEIQHKHKCPRCAREFESYRALGGHMKVHNVAGAERKGANVRKAKGKSATHVKPIQCDMCDLQFTSSTELHRHRKGHKIRVQGPSKGKPYVGQRVQVRFRSGAKYLGTIIEARLNKKQSGRRGSIKIRWHMCLQRFAHKID
mmetsp:Transcript_27155/g.50676  ORF Transcript_27155/g.50676 Transcript_27155/m.50676 type:complete len:727 (-) Transcript_27155:241-2421(-)